MRRALGAAEQAAGRGEVPVGAVVVVGDEIVAVAHNERETESDPTAHAEIVALRRAAAALGSWRLTGADLFVTMEPCPMCAGALVNARPAASLLRLRRSQGRRRADALHAARRSAPQSPGRGGPRRARRRGGGAAAIVLLAPAPAGGSDPVTGPVGRTASRRVRHCRDPARRHPGRVHRLRVGDRQEVRRRRRRLARRFVDERRAYDR